MKNINLLPYVLILSSVLSMSCSITRAYDDVVEMPDIKIEQSKMGNEVVFDDSDIENKVEQLATFDKEVKKQAQTVVDGKIETIQDRVGNTIEVRYFNNHPNLVRIIITTRPDGTKEVLAIGHNRENKRIPAEKADQALTLSGNQIADLAGIHSVKQTRSNRSMDGKSSRPVSQPAQNQTDQYQAPTRPVPSETQTPATSNIEPEK